MRIISEKTLKEYAARHPQVKAYLEAWVTKVKHCEWKCFSDIKRTYNTVDSIGNQRYVFNIKGNDYRLVVVIKFTPQHVFVRFVGTHSEYDKIDCKTI